MNNFNILKPVRDPLCVNELGGCRALETIFSEKLIAGYISDGDNEAKSVAAILRYSFDTANPLASIPNKRVRQKSKQVRGMLVVREIQPVSHTSEIASINHSRGIRSGGAMRGWYLMSEYELKKYFQTQESQYCQNRHDEFWLGVFAPHDRMVGFAQLKRIYNFAYIARFLVHAEGQSMGASHGLLSWAVEKCFTEFANLECVFYGHWDSGGEGLQRFKRYHGFTEKRLNLCIEENNGEHSS